MKDTLHFEALDGIVAFRPIGTMGFDAAVRLVGSAIEQALAQGQAGLMVDAVNLVGLAPPSVADRHAMVREWAEEAQGRLRIALVVSPDLVDADRFGVVVASNFGLVGNVFHTESDALAWLRTGRPA